MDTAVGARRRVRRFVLAAEDLRGELGAGGNGELRNPAAQLGLHCAARDVQAATSGRSHDGRAAHQAGLPTSEPAVAGHLGTLAVRARSPRRDAGAMPRAGPTTGPSGRRGRLRREPRRILSPRRRADTEDHDRSPSPSCSWPRPRWTLGGPRQRPVPTRRATTTLPGHPRVTSTSWAMSDPDPS